MSKFIHEFYLGQAFLFKGIECKVGFINNGCAWLSPIRDESSKGLYAGCAFVIIDEHRESSDGTAAISMKMLDKIIAAMVKLDVARTRCGAA